jgi:sulfate transport system ATP-binding protein
MGQVNRFPVPGEAGASAFARPHEIAVLARPDVAALPARLIHSAAIGPLARLEFALDHAGEIINVELPRAAWNELALGPGAVAYLKPTQLRQFDLPA